MRRLYSKMKKTNCYTKVLLLLFACAFVGISSATAKAVQVTGKVTDTKGGGMSGVTIVLKGNNATGVISGLNGLYTISVPTTESVLNFSFIGYKPQSIKVGTRSTINVTLEEDLTQMDEVVVVGFGSQKKKYLVGAVSQIGAKELMIAPMNNTSALMAGKLPGISTVQNSGQPGLDDTRIMIRGLSSFTNASPLILVDGIERMLNTVNPNDIANISILKDAATSAVYGVQAANGVILITTKKGSEGPAQITYNASATFTRNTALPDFLNAKDYLYYYNKASIMDTGKPYYDADIQNRVLNGDPNGLYGQTDWFEQIFKDYGFTQQHNISATGGSDKTQYFVSMGLIDQDGIIKNVNYSRYNVRANIETKIAKNFKLSMNIGAFHEKNDYPGLGFGKQAYLNPVTQAIYAPPIINTTYKGKPLAWKSGTTAYNAPASLERGAGFMETRRWQFEGSSNLEYDFSSIKALQGLKVNAAVSYDYSNTGNKNYLGYYTANIYDNTTKAVAEGIPGGFSSKGGTLNKSASMGDKLTFRPSISYNRTFADKHKVGALFLYEQMQSGSNTMTAYKNGYYFSYPIDLTLGQTYPSGDPNDPINSGSFKHAASRSYVGRVDYTFADKYIAEFSFRSDGSYIFQKDNRWGFFPAVALGWVVSEENFFKEAFPKVNMLKIRGSAGELGSNFVDPYLFMSTFAQTNGPAYVLGNQALSALYTNNAVISDLTWSRTKSYNIGFDLMMWDGLLGVEFDYFYKYTYDLLERQDAEMPTSLGGNYSSFANSGRLDNRGLEVVLKHSNNVGKDWFYSLTANVSWARNRVLSQVHGANSSATYSVLGRPQGTVYGFRVIGMYQTQDQIDNSPKAPSGDKRLGDLMYEDVNGDGIIDRKDFVKIGNGTTPELNFSMNMHFQWKDLFLTAVWQGASVCSYQLSGTYGHGSTDNTAFTRPFYEGGNAPYYLVEGAWTPENRDAKYPRLSLTANGNNAWQSDWWTKDGSYLRLKNLQVGYSLPKSILKNTGIGALSVYVAGTNLVTFSSFKYVDPEMPDINNGYYPQQKTYSIGVNLTF